ncbi:MAG: hypothetical protein NVS4B3_19680 [Gemmatimonadaceae bacterium]
MPNAIAPRQTPSSFARRFYRWTRDVHLYVGLGLSPFVIVYAISAILLNHAYLPWGGRHSPTVTRRLPVAVRDDANSLHVAKEVREQIRLRGEIGYVIRDPRTRRISFPLETPGEVTQVRVDLDSAVATLEHQDTGVWDALIYLHKMPGPHNAKIRGNWVFTRLWGWLADATVYLLLFLSASGVYLWTVLKADRKAGLLFIGAGALSFAGIVTVLLA